MFYIVAHHALTHHFKQLEHRAPIPSCANSGELGIEVGIVQFGAPHTVRKVQVDLAMAYQELIGPRPLRIEMADGFWVWPSRKE